MDSTDLQLTFTVVVVLTAAAVAVVFDYLRKQRQLHHATRGITLKPAYARRSPMMFVAAPMAYAPVKTLRADPITEPLVATVTASRPPVQPRERETVTVEMAPPSPPAPSNSTEFQLHSSLPAVTIDAALWERLIASQPRQNLLSPAADSPRSLEPACHLIRQERRGAPPVRQLSLATREPAGMIQQPVLEEMLDRGASFTGLVVSIGINDSDSSMWHSQGLMLSVGSHIAALLTETDFACRVSYDEFVMAIRGENAAHLQRRLNHIAERLWDYQLRGVASCSILFIWGAAQVINQPLADAIASATERMRENKRIGQADKSTRAHRLAV